MMTDNREMTMMMTEVEDDNMDLLLARRTAQDPGRGMYPRTVIRIKMSSIEDSS